MPNTPSPSFIPKQPAAKHSRRVMTRQVHVFTVLTYLLFFTTLVASGGIFFYQRYVESQKNDAVSALDAAIANFSEFDMDQVQAFNVRLEQATQRLEKSVSVISIFESLEAATLQSVEIVDFSLKRESDERFVVSADVNTDTFDSALFQRGVFERNTVVDAVTIDELGVVSATEEEPADGVAFTAILHIPVSEVPYEPDSLPVPTDEGSTTTQSTGTTTLSDNALDN